MGYSEKLDGFYEEGYHYYIEIREGRMSVRDYRRAVALETDISYDAEAVERGESTEIFLKDNVLSRAADGSRMSEIRSLFYESGELKLLHYYTVMGETLYTLKKVGKGPFEHITIRDAEFLDALQGEWAQWLPNGKRGDSMMIVGNTLSWLGLGPFAFHAVSYAHSPGRVRLVPEDLIQGDFGGFTAVDVEGDMLTTRMMVCDASVPLTVFARKDMLDKLQPPPDAFSGIRSTMLPEEKRVNDRLKIEQIPPHTDGDGMIQTPPWEKIRFCRDCGHDFGKAEHKFCPECGAKRW